MMTGVVNANLETILRLQVLDINGGIHEVETLIDSGFNGFLTLPPAQIATLRLPFLYRQQGQLADGSILIFNVHAATVLWDGQPRTAEVEEIDAQPLLGTAMLHNHELRIQVIDGGSATITALS